MDARYDTGCFVCLILLGLVVDVGGFVSGGYDAVLMGDRVLVLVDANIEILYSLSGERTEFISSGKWEQLQAGFGVST